MLEGAITLRAVERPLPSVCELVPPHVRHARERLTARFARRDLLLDVRLRYTDFALIVRWFWFTLLCISQREELDGRTYLISAAGRRRKLGF